MENGKKTMVIGASTNPTRYSYRCIHQLTTNGHPVVAIGLKDGEVAGNPITQALEPHEGIDTVTLYVGPKNQAAYMDYVLNTIKPKRLIFNPGTENDAFMQSAIDQGIDAFEACTLVMMGTDQY